VPLAERSDHVRVVAVESAHGRDRLVHSTPPYL
jgi:hypothetical protein